MFKVWILGVGESTFATNALEFATVEEANTYGNDLLSRWFGADRFVVLPLSDDFKGYLAIDVADANAMKVEA